MGDRKTTHRIADLPAADRPRERLAAVGAENLSTPELLAILLRTGVAGRSAVQLAHDLLSEAGGLAGLCRLPYETLRREHGVGPAKAAQVKAALELAGRLARQPENAHEFIQSPEDVARRLGGRALEEEQECLWVLLLDTRNRLLKEYELYHGALNANLIRVGEVFAEAVRVNAASLIVAHNHPSGDPSPSPEDVTVTRSIVEAGRLLDVEVLDHVILGANRHVSMKAKGLGFD
jgi:DNA repair protein RadC